MFSDGRRIRVGRVRWFHGRGESYVGNCWYVNFRGRCVVILVAELVS